MKLIDKMEIEGFTFRKQTSKIKSSEAPIHRHIDNKRKYLICLVNESGICPEHQPGFAEVHEAALQQSPNPVRGTD